MGLTRLHGYGEKLFLGIVVSGRSQLHGFCATVVGTTGIGFKPIAFLGVVIGRKGDAAAQYGRVVLHQMT